VRAERGREAESIYQRVAETIESLGVHCATGEFGADMSVLLTNDGPVTILLDSDRSF